MKSKKFLQDSNFLVTQLNPDEKVYEFGKGCSLKATDGKSYLDFTSGDGICSTGYDTDAVVKALGAKNLVYSPNKSYTPQKGEAAAAICRVTGMDRIMFADDFIEAEELSVRFARRVYAENANKYKIVLVKSLASDGSLPKCSFIPAGLPKAKYGETLFGGYILVSPNDIKGLKTACADKNVCAIYLEMMDFCNAYTMLSVQFTQAVKEFSQQYKHSLIINENDTFGRSDEACAYQNYDLDPDIVVLGKNCSAGMPFGAVCVKKSLAKVFDWASLNYSFRARPFICSIAKNTVNEITGKAMRKNVAANEKAIEKHLDKLRRFNNVIRRTDMMGYSCIMEFVDKYPAASVADALKEKGLLVKTVASLNAILLLPQFTATSADIGKAFKILGSLCSEYSKK